MPSRKHLTSNILTASNVSEREKFASRLKLTREQRHQGSAASFAKSIGLEAETYRMYERGKREPDIATIIKISRALDISLDFLILGDLPSYNSNATTRR